MPKLKINAPDGKLLSIDVPEGTDPSKYDSIVDEVVSDYTNNNSTASSPEPEDFRAPSALKSAALGVMSGIPGGETLSSAVRAIGDKTYEQAHQDIENEKNQAWEEHPVAYGTGKTAGIVGTGIAAPEGIPGALAIGAASGADTATNLKEIPSEVTKGAAVGGALGAAGKYIAEPLINKVAEFLPNAAKGMVASLGGKTTVNDIESYLKNPEAIRTALSRPEVANELANATGDVTQASRQLSTGARDILNPTNTVDIKDLKNAVMETAKKYFADGNIVTPADETAVKSLIDQYQKFSDIAEQNGGKVPETTLRSWIDRMQAATKDSTFGNPEASASQRAIKDVSGHFNDLLRKTNPDYAEAMAPSAEAADLSQNLQKHFSLENGQPTDATSTKINNVLKEQKPEGRALLDELQGLTGQDFVQKLMNSQTRENFEAAGSGSALKTAMAGLGFALGRTSEVPFGGIGGAAVGRYAAEGMNGGNIAKNILDAYINVNKNHMVGASKALIQKFGPVLVNAAKAGGNQLAATHFVLATSNPEYQELTQHMQDHNSDTNTGIVNQE